MNTKKLLLLVLTILLASTGQNICAASEFAGFQEYSDTNTDSLLSETSRELMQAYDLLDMLKKRSEEIAYQEMTLKKESGQTLPRNIDHIRNQLIKKQLLDVLSATPFSNPEKHLKDCKAAITALEEYMAEITKMQAQASPLTTEHSPAATELERSIAAEYNITNEASTVEKASTVVPASPPARLPISSKITETLSPIMAPPVHTPPTHAIAPVTPAPTIAAPLPLPVPTPKTTPTPAALPIHTNTTDTVAPVINNEPPHTPAVLTPPTPMAPSTTPLPPVPTPTLNNTTMPSQPAPTATESSPTPPPAPIMPPALPVPPITKK